MSDKQLRCSVGPFRYVKRELLDGADEPLLIKSIGGYDDRINLYEGDWHLFAAAPEMLEALKKARQYVYWAACAGFPNAVELDKEINSVIAKAEGRENEA